MNTNVEYAAQLADQGEFVVLIAPGGVQSPPDWRYGDKPTSRQLRLWMQSWPNAPVRVVRGGKLVDPLAPKPKNVAVPETLPFVADENATLRAQLDGLAGVPATVALPVLIAVPILVPVVVEHTFVDLAMVEGMQALMSALEAMAGMLGQIDLAALPRESFDQLLRAAMLEEARRDNTNG